MKPSGRVVARAYCGHCRDEGLKHRTPLGVVTLDEHNRRVWYGRLILLRSKLERELFPPDDDYRKVGRWRRGVVLDRRHLPFLSIDCPRHGKWHVASEQLSAISANVYLVRPRRSQQPSIWLGGS